MARSELTALEVGGAARFPCFDGLRATAALAVLTFHCLGALDPSWLRGRTWMAVWELGPEGVAIFFVISGFLLYRPFAVAHFERRRGPLLSAFWTRRAFRILPAYWVALTFMVYVFHNAVIHGASQFFMFYGLLQNYRHGFELSGLGVAWTLVIEVCFYALLPLIAFGLHALGGRDERPTRRLYGELFGLLLLVCVAVGVRAWFLWGTDVRVLHRIKVGAWFSWFALHASIVWWLDVFALGLLLAIGSAWQATRSSLPPIVDRLARRPWRCWAIAGVVYVVLARMPLGGLGNPRATRFNLFVEPVLCGVAAALIAFPAVFGDQGVGALRRLLRSGPATYLGRISYGIYLWHLIVIGLTAQWVRHGSLHGGPLFRLALILALTFAAASASYYAVERPLTAIGSRWSARLSANRGGSTRIKVR